MMIIGERVGIQTRDPLIKSQTVLLFRCFLEMDFQRKEAGNQLFVISVCFRLVPYDIFQLLTVVLTAGVHHGPRPHFQAIGRRSHLPDRARSRGPLGRITFGFRRNRLSIRPENLCRAIPAGWPLPPLHHRRPRPLDAREGQVRGEKGPGLSRARRGSDRPEEGGARGANLRTGRKGLHVRIRADKEATNSRIV